jgi:hypothetical protein
MAGNGKAVYILYELRVIEAYGWNVVIALLILNLGTSTAKAANSLRPGQRDSIVHGIGVWVDPRARLDTAEKRKI